MDRSRMITNLGIGLGCLMLLAALASQAHAQVGEDKILFKDSKRTPEVCRVIKETFRGVEYLKANQPQPPIPLNEVERVEYAGDPWGPVQNNINSSEFERALGDIDRLLKDAFADKKWRDQYCLFYAGYCLERMQKWKEAIQKYEECRKAVPDTRFLKEIHVNMHNCYHMMGDATGVEKTLKAFEEESRNKGMWEADVDGLRATHHESRGQWDQALTIYRKNKSSRDKDGADRARAGELRCLLQMGRETEAARVATGIINTKDASPAALAVAYAAQGAEQLKQNNLDEALMSFLRVVLGVEQGRGPVTGTFEFDFASYGTIKALVEKSIKESVPEKKEQLRNKAMEFFRDIRHPKFREMAQKELDRKG